MSSMDERYSTPPPPAKSSGARHMGDMTKTPTLLPMRPATPARRSKQDFVLDLWQLLSSKLQPMFDRQGAGAGAGAEEEKEEGVDFGELTAFLRDASVMECTSRFWAVLTSFVAAKRLGKGAMRAEMKEARIILTSLIIAFFPNDTLDVSDLSELSEDPLSEAVYNGACDLIKDVLNNSPADAGDVCKLRCESAAKTISDFIAAFEAWKRKDVSKVMASLENYYEEWVRSRAVLVASSMNEMQRNAVLETIQGAIANTRLKMGRLVGKAAADSKCAEIDERIATEEPHVHSSPTARTSVADAPTPTTTPADSFVVDDTSHASAMSTASTADKLKAYGIPSKMRSGLATPSATPAMEGTDATVTGTADGPMRIDLDAIIAEESAKKYWSDFSDEIEQGKFHRLFELLSEMLSRLKKVSPEGDAAYLDDLMDVAFIRQSIEHGSLDARGFYAIFDALWTQMSRLHAAAFDAEWKEWRDAVVVDMAKTDATWARLLPDVLNRLLCKLDEIEDAIKALQPYIKAGSKLKDDDDSTAAAE